MNAERKVMSPEEIRRIAPGYRGKAENFDPERVGKPRGKPKRDAKRSSQAKGPQSAEVPAPMVDMSTSQPTPQRNESIISEAIFGVDVRVTPITPHENFNSSYANLQTLSEETFDQYATDERQLDRVIERSEFVYYTTSLLWMRLIDLKAKLAIEALTDEEQEIRTATVDETFNIPQPIYIYLAQIGDVVDKMGKTTEIAVPPLPIAVAGGFGGYHAQTIDVDTHNIFEEVPTLGIAADSVMALTSVNAAPQTAVRVALPRGARVTSNLLCYVSPIVQRRDEIKRRLAGQGITTTTFPEFVTNTRFNLKYIKSLSDIVGKFETFSNERTVFRHMPQTGGETQVIQTKPIGEDPQANWKCKTVVATSATKEAPAAMGAAYMFGFQLHKHSTGNADITLANNNWSCITSHPGAQPWAMDAAWAATANARRNVPEGIGTERFRTISRRQSTVTTDAVRRMIKTHR